MVKQAQNWRITAASVLLCLALAACQPPAADDYVERVELAEQRGFASDPLPSPVVEGAVWALQDNRLLYGQPGQRPLLSLACEGDDANSRTLLVTRLAKADPQAKALMALIGNGHVERLKIDATWNGKAWLWQGRFSASDPRLDVLTGPRAVELTIPGAGTVGLNPSQRPRDFIDQCRGTVYDFPQVQPPEPGVRISADAPPVR